MITLRRLKDLTVGDHFHFQHSSGIYKLLGKRGDEYLVKCINSPLPMEEYIPDDKYLYKIDVIRADQLVDGEHFTTLKQTHVYSAEMRGWEKPHGEQIFPKITPSQVAGFEPDTLVLRVRTQIRFLLPGDTLMRDWY